MIVNVIISHISPENLIKNSSSRSEDMKIFFFNVNYFYHCFRFLCQFDPPLQKKPPSKIPPFLRLNLILIKKTFRSSIMMMFSSISTFGKNYPILPVLTALSSNNNALKTWINQVIKVLCVDTFYWYLFQLIVLLILIGLVVLYNLDSIELLLVITPFAGQVSCRLFS